MSVNIKGAGVLAGAYKGKDISERATLTHAVADGPISVGRLKRDAGEAFCTSSLNEYDGNLVDSGAWEAASNIDCPKCLEHVGRVMAKLGALD